MLPEVAGRKRVSRLKQVVLPAPLGPIKAWMVPRRTRKSTPLTATKPRNSLDRPRVSRMTSAASGTRLLSRKAASRASTGALERCDPGASSSAFRRTSWEYTDDPAAQVDFPRCVALRGRCLCPIVAIDAESFRQPGQPALDQGEGQARPERPLLRNARADPGRRDGQSSLAGLQQDRQAFGRRAQPDAEGRR